MLEFGMWIGYGIQKGAPPESCNCSTMEPFKTWNKECARTHQVLDNGTMSDDPAGKTSFRIDAIKLIIARRFRLELIYNQEMRFVSLYLTEGQCCNHPEVTFVIEYIRQKTNPCPTLRAGTSDSTLECLPLFLGLFNVVIFNNLVLIRGQGYGLLLTITRNNPYTFDEDQFLWVERMLEFGMWIGYDIQKGAPPESCNCSTMEPFKTCNQFSNWINADQLEWFERLIEFGMWTGVDILQESSPESCDCSTLKGFREWYKNCKLANLVESNHSLPLYNMTKESKVAQEMGLSTMEQWIILGVVCGLLMLVGVMIESGSSAHEVT
ncbi:hypothetical protein pipiens_002143 [Culex pipiens pipiens]|uniref:Uncharacterized protein n=1 Tax=Culex pipiens pipiens TaxID=38569 RepID=A0ABD1DJM6_CULPP